MRKIILSISALIFAIVAKADDNKVYSLDINYLLHEDGSAVVTEVWDIDVAEGTEWYLVRNNMRDIEVKDFMVMDEKWSQYIFEESWDIDRKLEEKAGRCGIVETDEGLELCWGLGSYGRHSYTVVYTLTNAVQMLNDYDMFHFQTVNKKLSTPPEKVRTTVEVKDCQLDTTNVRLWGFGYEGSARLAAGKALFASSEPFVEESSMICLLRFNKGIFGNGSVLDKPFEEHLSVALENSGYIDGDEPEGWAIAAGVIGGVLLVVFGIVAIVRLSRRRVLGMNYNEVEESREIPFGGNLYVANRVLDELLESRDGSSVAAALIIRMIYKDTLRVNQIDDENIEICFNPDFDVESLDRTDKILYNMLKAAGGEDAKLQEDEFENWSSDHEKRVAKWDEAVEKAAKKFIEEKGYKLDGRYSSDFQREARKLLGLKKYLQRFTEFKKADISDVERLKEYLVYAALFEIADEVVKQINTVNPAAFESLGPYSYNTWYLIMNHNTTLSKTITNTVITSGGTGGSSSFGGGGGFSGGGVGGGAR